MSRGANLPQGQQAAKLINLFNQPVKLSMGFRTPEGGSHSLSLSTCCQGNPVWLATKAASNCHIIKSSAGATIIHIYVVEPQQAALTIVAALGLSLGLAHGISWPSLEHLRFLPTQFTLITDFRQRDNISDAPQRNPLPPHTHTHRHLYVYSIVLEQIWQH